MIKDFKAGIKVCQAVLVRVQKVGNSSNGGVFAKGMADDNSGRIQFIAFEKGIVNTLRNIEGPQPMMVAGAVDIWTGMRGDSRRLVCAQLSVVRRPRAPGRRTTVWFSSVESGGPRIAAG